MEKQYIESLIYYLKQIENKSQSAVELNINSNGSGYLLSGFGAFHFKTLDELVNEINKKLK